MGSLRHNRWLIWAATAAALAVTVFLSTWYLLAGDAVDVPPLRPDAALAGVGRPGEAGGAMRFTPQQLAQAMRVPLRQQLFDPPPAPPPPAPPAPPPPPMPVRLMMTIMGNGEPRAMLADAQGRTLFVSVGDSVGDNSRPVKVLEIHQTHLLVEYAGKQVQMQQDQTP